HQGQNINTPQSTHQIKRQYKDDFGWSQNVFGFRNDFKIGGQYVDEPTLGGDFSTGLTGQFNHFSDEANSPITDITFFGGFFGDKTPVKQYSGYVQDDLYPMDRLTVSVGMRYDLWKGFDLDQRSNPIWQALATQTRYNTFYLQDFQGGKGGVLKNDTNNYAPRIGFVYDLKGDGRMLFRGGYGTYYDFPYTNATILFPASAVQSNYGVVYNVTAPPCPPTQPNCTRGIRNADGSFFHVGQPLPPNGLTSPDLQPPNEVASPTLATPYSDQKSLGFAWQWTDHIGLDFSLVSIDYHKIPFRFRANPKDPATGARRFPQFGNFRLWYGKGRASYDGANVGVRVHMTKVDLQGFYTYSKSKGNVLAGADEFRINDRGYQPGLPRDVSVNPLDPLCGACFGPLDTDARHKLTFGGTYSGPWGVNVSGMFRYRSATPYIDYITSDPNNDGFAEDLRPGVGHVNTLRGHSFQQLDVRLARDFRFGGEVGVELLAEMFNVFNEKNPSSFHFRFNSAGQQIVFEPTSFSGDPGQGEQRLIQLGARVHF
ncbi:MAG TPA: TonB-dependent receptor, partial [Thermoanaerobaculia bacterium]|nr:TonB-dependent receptor [Thermoanaerobaculia bacterium]